MVRCLARSGSSVRTILRGCQGSSSVAVKDTSGYSPVQFAGRIAPPGQHQDQRHRGLGNLFPPYRQLLPRKSISPSRCSSSYPSHTPPNSRRHSTRTRLRSTSTHSASTFSNKLLGSATGCAACCLLPCGPPHPSPPSTPPHAAVDRARCDSFPPAPNRHAACLVFPIAALQVHTCSIRR